VSAARLGADPMLELAGVSAGYGHFTALWDVALRVNAGEAVAVVGPNGAGKTTLLRVISGVIAPRVGTLTFEGAALAGRPAHEIVAHGIAHVPEGRRLFPALTVADNLKMGAFLPAARSRFAESLERVFGLFPVLEERRAQRAGSLSGGEQQMLAIGRALMSRPKLILLDEPSMGLAPVMVLRLFDLIRLVRAEGYTILVVEQNVRQVLKLVDRAYLLEVGRIKMEGRADELSEQDFVRKAYVGL
jgi:branched-chain amino acid transport system ATP-binding protein